MKRKFIITEVVSYAVKAESAAQAERIFEDTPNPDAYFNSSSGREIEAAEPSTLKVGDQVNVDAHGDHDEDFSGVVVDITPPSVGNIMVEAPDGAIYGCDPDYVYVPTTGEPEPPESAHEDADEGCGCGFLHGGLCNN